MNKKHIRWTIMIVIAAVLMLAASGCSGSVNTIAEGKVDNIRWALDENGCLSFTGSGALPGVEYVLNTETGQTETIRPEWYNYRDQVTEIIVGSSIESVSMNAFMNFAGLRFIDLCSTVHHVDGYAVTGCGALERVIIRSSSVELEKYCIGYVGGAADDGLSDVVFEGARGSQTEQYADQCGARFDAL